MDAELVGLHRKGALVRQSFAISRNYKNNSIWGVVSSERQCILQGRMMTEVGVGTHRDDQSPCCSEGRGERAPEAKVTHLLCPVSFFKLRLIRQDIL